MCVCVCLFVCLLVPKGKDSLYTVNEILLHKRHCFLKVGPFSNIYLLIYLNKQHYLFSMLRDLIIQGVQLKTESRQATNLTALNLCIKCVRITVKLLYGTQQKLLRGTH